MKSFFQKYLLPGFVFQSVVIAGGYGTGRELVEFFLSYGPSGGLLAIVVATAIWSMVCAATFEFARYFGVYDYRRFFQALLGPGWILFEICYAVLLAIVLAIIASAAGSVLLEALGIPYSIGVLAMTTAVGLLVFMGSRSIERFLSAWSFVLYAVFIVFFMVCFLEFGPAIREAFAAHPVRDGWPVGGLKYASYNLGVIPAVLFCVRHCSRARESIGAGLLAGPIAIVPGVLFYLAMVGQYPAVLDRPVPANFLLDVLGSSTLQIVFQVALFGTLFETGTAMIHAVNERVAGLYVERGRELPSWTRPAVAITLLLAGLGIAQFGLIGLIAKGYGTITWGFLAVFVIPILTWGVYKRIRAASGNSNAPQGTLPDIFRTGPRAPYSPGSPFGF